MLGRDPAALEIVADQGVAGAARGELLRPRAGEALVVHVADPLERLERLLPLLGADAALLEPRVELRRRAVAVRSARSACSRASGRSGMPLGRGGGFLLLLDLVHLVHDRRRLLRGSDGRQQPRRDRLLGPGLCLDLLEDLLDDVRVLLQERGGVLAALAEPLVAEAEVRARLLRRSSARSRRRGPCSPRRCPMP